MTDTSVHPRWQFLPSMTADEYARLKQSIADHGFLAGQEIVRDEDGRILDGHHRAKACAELGVDCPSRTVAGMSDAEKWDYVWLVNVPRRHLPLAERLRLVREYLRRHADQSNSQVAAAAGVDRKTVGAIREVLEGNREVPILRANGGRGNTQATADVVRCDGCERMMARPRAVTASDGRKGHASCMARPAADEWQQAPAEPAYRPNHLGGGRWYLVYRHPVPSNQVRDRAGMPYTRESETLDWVIDWTETSVPVPTAPGAEVLALATEIGNAIVREMHRRPLETMPQRVVL